MRWLWQAFVILIFLCFPVAAHAGAWPQPPGETQLIISFEPGSASKQFDANGHSSIPLTDWKSTDFSLYADHGITDRFTLTGKVNFRDYHTGAERFSGLNSVELGGRYTLHKGKDFVLAVGASVEGLGKGRRSDFDTTSKQGTDWDLRAYLGKSFKLGKTDAFIDIEAARHLRQYDADQWRIDTTVGLKPSPRWMILAQSFAGQIDRQGWGQAKWNNVQISVARSFGPRQETTVQLGLRDTVTGRNVPAVHSLIVSLWRRF